MVDLIDRGVRMKEISDIISLLDKLDEKKIYYRLSKIRSSILIEVAVPGERWEIEYMSDGSVEVEKFTTTGEILGKEEIDVLFRDFSD